MTMVHDHDKKLGGDGGRDNIDNNIQEDDDDIVGEETRNDRRKHKPRVTGGSQWESGATAAPLFRFILLFHDDVMFSSQWFCTRDKRGKSVHGKAFCSSCFVMNNS